MKLKELWRRFCGRPKTASQPLTETEPSASSSSENRALVWLGKDKLERQRFYEKWAARETWQVYNEGITLLLGRDPGDKSLVRDQEFNEQREQSWEHLQRCVRQQASPHLANPAEKPEQWRAAPVELYRWAVAARLEIPQELDDLLSFISRTIRPVMPTDEAPVAQSDQGETQSLAREQVLTVMLSLAMQAQHQATGASADVIREQILGTLYDKSERYFDQPEPPLSRPALHDLIDRSLEMAGLIYIPG